VTWHHVALVLFALASVLACGLSQTCGPSLPAVVQLATVVISGTLGHAGARITAKRHEEPARTLLPREPDYDSQPGRRRT
jgi:hypothetical protein